MDLVVKFLYMIRAEVCYASPVDFEIFFAQRLVGGFGRGHVLRLAESFRPFFAKDSPGWTRIVQFPLT
jgi:hypothetical protein